MSISLGLSCLEFSCLPGSVSVFPSSFLGKFSAIISSNMISASFLLSLPPGSSLNWALVHLILSHKTLKVSPIFFFIFLYLCLIWWVPSTCLWVHGFVLFSHPVCCWTPLVYFSVQLIYSAALILHLVLSYIFHLFAEILSVFIFLLPSLISLFMTFTFDSLLGKLLICILLRFFSWGLILFFHLEESHLLIHFSWFSELVFPQ